MFFNETKSKDAQMPTPQAYGRLSDQHEYLRAMVFKLMMSDEMPDISGPLASVVFDLVGDQTEAQADDAVRAFEAA
jgi:hypothetical protein